MNKPVYIQKVIPLRQALGLTSDKSKPDQIEIAHRLWLQGYALAHVYKVTFPGKPSPQEGVCLIFALMDPVSIKNEEKPMPEPEIVETKTTSEATSNVVA